VHETKSLRSYIRITDTYVHTTQIMRSYMRTTRMHENTSEICVVGLEFHTRTTHVHVSQLKKVMYV
jgi:hypothetical protein